MSILCVLSGPRHEYSRLGDPPEAMSYYSPIAKIECPQCREEHVLFPGREWVHPEEAS